MAPVGRLVVLKTTRKSELVRAIATLTWPALIAPVLGPPVGGFITTYASWRWIFFLNLPIGHRRAPAWPWPSSPTIARTPARPSTARASRSRPCRWPAWSMASISSAGREAQPTPGARSSDGRGLALGAWALRHARQASHPLIDFWGC